MHALTPDELLDFSTAETRRWQQWFSSNPQALDLPLDIAQATSVRELVLHIAAVQLRYAERLLDQKVTEYHELRTDAAELFATLERSAEMLQKFGREADDPQWARVLTFPTRSAGTLSASKRKIFVHALLHGMRHWSQLATILRQQGYRQPWPHDFIFSDVMP